MLLSGAKCRSAEAFFFDLGGADSPAAPDCRVLTEAGIEGLATWETDTGIGAATQPIRREWTYSEGSGRNDPPPSYLTELTCDHLRGAGTATLVLRLPTGAYRLWFLSGAAGGSQAQVWDTTVRCSGAAATVTTAGGIGVREMELTGQADNGELRLTVSSRSRWVLNALFAVPVADWARCERERLEPLRRAVFLLPPEVFAEWKELPRAAEAEPGPWPPEVELRGFALFHRHYLEPVWPGSVPTPSELSAPVRAFAAWGEYEPMTFTLHPLRDGGPVDVDVSDLTAANGDRIPRASIDVRYVRFLHVRPNYRTFGTTYRAPDVLMPWQPQPLRAGENLRLWLTVRTPAAATATVYRGTATVRGGDGAPPAEVALLFRVVPIQLEKDRSLVYGQYYHHPYQQLDQAPDPFSRQWWERKAEFEHADMAAHGNNTLVLGLGGRRVGGRWELQFDRLERCIQLYYRHGFHQPVICHFPVSALYAEFMKGGMGSHLRLLRMPPPEFFAELTALVRRIEDERRRRLWPELLYYPVDEPSRTPLAVTFMAAVMKAIKEVPGVRTYVTADPAHEEFAPLKPHVDVWCCQPFSLDREEVLRDMGERRVEYWCYPNHIAGENDHTPCAGARMTYGFGFWRSGFRALTPWIYQAIVGDQWNYLDGGAMDFFNRTDDDASPIPVALWEAYREGIDDGRYITTLERTIERAKAAGLREQALAAESDLQMVWAAIRVQPKYKEDGLWDAETFDVYRWVLASRIMALQQALRP
ncbi:MAG: hypothetical protein JXR77_13435 [Lentisphaeria bacterium]|nr:hypothetical protein [Lentisphaeria bacterium]